MKAKQLIDGPSYAPEALLLGSAGGQSHSALEKWALESELGALTVQR